LQTGANGHLLELAIPLVIVILKLLCCDFAMDVLYSIHKNAFFALIKWKNQIIVTKKLKTHVGNDICPTNISCVPILEKL
jgi:hypothetical protein